MSKALKVLDLLQEGSNKWTIMNAHALFKGKADVARIIAELGDGVIHAVKIDGSPAFVYGSGNAPYNKPEDNISYVQDTGSGYGKRGSIELEGYAVIKNGQVEDEMGFPQEKRRVWVFK